MRIRTWFHHRLKDIAAAILWREFNDYEFAQEESKRKDAVIADLRLQLAMSEAGRLGLKAFLAIGYSFDDIPFGGSDYPFERIYVVETAEEVFAEYAKPDEHAPHYTYLTQVEQLYPGPRHVVQREIAQAA